MSTTQNKYCFKSTLYLQGMIVIFVLLHILNVLEVNYEDILWLAVMAIIWHINFVPSVFSGYFLQLFVFLYFSSNKQTDWEKSL